MKKKLMRSFLQKNEINVCMVELLKKYGAYIRAKAIRAVSNEAEREELTAGIIIHLYEKLSKMVYTEEGKFEYWLHTVVNHYIISWRRKRAKKLPISDICRFQTLNWSEYLRHRLLWGKLFIVKDYMKFYGKL